MAGPITISVLGDTRDLVRGVSGAKGELGTLGKSAGKMGKLVKLGFLAAGAGALYGAKKLVDFTKAAVEDEAAQSRLAETLKNTTGATDKQVAGVEKWIEKQGKLLGVTDDELRPALQRMAEGTKSVTKAQDMVSLAMDVSAGTGKSLKSVTEALLRAQNGAIGGLSRYGIATKDAKGKTLSLKEVTAGMAETFGGQATKQAGTLEGKLDRLKLMGSELGETIGSKLIPKVSALAGWIVDEAIPAVSDFWDNLAPAREAVANVADGVGQVLGAIRGGNWKQAWTKASDATEGGLRAIARGVGKFATSRLIPAVKDALEATRRSWANRWAGFWKDPEHAYDKTLNSTDSFGIKLRNKTITISTQATAAIAKGLRAMPATVAKVGGNTYGSFNAAVRGMPGLASHIGASVTGNLLKGLRNLPTTTGQIMGNVLGGLRDGGNAAVAAAGRIGVEIVAGMIAGVQSMGRELVDAATGVVGNAIQGARNLLEINSPSRVFQRMGHGAVEGLVLGLRDRRKHARGAGADMIAALLAGLRGNSIRSTVSGLADDALETWEKRHERGLRRRLAGHDQALAAAQRRLERTVRTRRRGLGNALADEARQLDRLGSKYRPLIANLDRARTKLNDLTKARADYAAGVAQAAQATANVTQLGLLEDNTQTAAGLTAGLTARLDAVRNFNAKLTTLIRQGLKGEALRQIVDAGVDAGTITAEALLAGGPSAVAEVVRLQGAIDKAAGDLGETAAAKLHDAGIKAQKGLLRGLEKDRRALDRTAGRIADRIANTIRKRLGGALDTTPNRPRSVVDRDVATHPRTRIKTAPGAPGSAPRTITLTADQITRLQRGKELHLDLEAYYAAGGRRRA